MSHSNVKMVRGGLLRNENIKLWSQAGMRAVLITVLVICLLIPVFLGGVSALTSNGDYLESLTSQCEYWQDEAEFNVSWADEDTENSQMWLLEAQYDLTYARAYLFFIENELPEWKYDYYFYTYLRHALRLRAAELLVEDTALAGGVVYSSLWSELEEVDDFSSVMASQSSDGSLAFYRIGDSLDEGMEISAADFLAYVRNDLARVTSFITTATFSDELVKLYNSSLMTLTQYRTEAAELALALAAAPEDSTLRYEYESAMLAVEGYSALTNGYGRLIEDGASYGSWRLTTVDDGVFSAAMQLANSAVMPEVAFGESYLALYYNSYDEYAADMERQAESARRALELLEYSLEWGIPYSGALKSSVKSDMNQSVAMSAGLVLIFMVVAAGTTVSNEFSSGTVRLLLAHPRRRHKILSAKIFSVLFWTLLLVTATVVGQLAINLAFNGVSDLLVPDLYYINGRVVELPGIVRLLETLGYSLLPALLMAALALLFSCLTRKAALAVALPLVVDAILGTVAQVALALRTTLPLLDWTLLPYYDMVGLVHDPLAEFLSSGLTFVGIGSALGSTAGLHAAIGALMFALATAVLLVLSYIGFARRQIKS